MSLLSVSLLGKKSSILPMLAPCLSIAATAGSSLINILVYPDDGDWPWALSFVPFFAQGRALYIILVYHRTSVEVDTSISLLFFVGLFCLVITYILEENIPIVSLIKMYWADRYYKEEDTDKSPELRNSLLSNEDEYCGVDEDVTNEKLRAMHYSPSTDNTLAIVIKHLSHEYFATNGVKKMKAVEELSLALSFGECFGLLGPNGAGM
jgi:hypothetical protein